MKYSNLFPYVTPGWLLHQFPQGGQVKLQRPPDDPSQRGIWEVTPLAIAALLLCDGRRTLQQVLTEISLRHEGQGFSAAESVAGFLVEAVRLGVLSFQDEPLPREITVKGSRKAYYPLHLAIELTDCCNLRCRHCYRGAGNENSVFFPTEPLLRILDEMRGKGVHSLELSGGEPTMHPDFGVILDFSLRKFGAISILTNGTTRLADHHLPVLEEFKEKLMVQVDLDGCCAREHDLLRAKEGAFDASVETIRTLASRGIRVRVAMVIHPENIQSIDKTYRLAKALGAKWFAASPVIDLGRASEDLFLTRDQLELAIRCLDDLAEKDPLTITSADELKRTAGKLGTNCGAGSRALTLGPDGQMRPCFLVNKKLPAFKNILECPTDEALNSAPLMFFHSLQPPCPEVCGQCDYVPFCNGCVARPLIAWERATRQNRNFVCRWNEATGFGKRLGYAGTIPGAVPPPAAAPPSA